MKVFVIILCFCLSSCVYGLNTDEFVNINVLETLKARNSSCDLHVFINSNENSEDEYKLFINDLTEYCSNSTSKKLYQVLCHMILIELEIGCSISNQSHLLPIKYKTSLTATKICSMDKLIYINRWIWKKLDLDEREQIGPTSVNLCSIITSLKGTNRLARFFYRIAPYVRRFEIEKNQSLSPKSLPFLSNNNVNLTKYSYRKKSNKTG